MALLRQLSSHACKHYMALVALRTKGQPIATTIAELSHQTGLHEGLIRTTRGELVKHGLVEIVGRSSVRLLTPGKPWVELLGRGDIGGKGIAKNSTSRKVDQVGGLAGGRISPRAAGTNPRATGESSRQQGINAKALERTQAVELLAWAASRLGLRTHPGTQYGKTCLRLLLRRLKEGSSPEDLKRAVQNAASRREQGDKFIMLHALPWIWGRGFETLLSAKAVGGTAAGTSTKEREDLEAEWSKRSHHP